VKKRVLLAGLYHETNTFLRATSGLSDFDVKIGEEIWAAEGDVSPLSGALEVGRHSGWDLVPLVDMRATPGATVSDEVVAYFWDALLLAGEQGATREADGVYLILHGAMVSESSLDVEGEILSRIRCLPGLAEKPLCGVVGQTNGNLATAVAGLELVTSGGEIIEVSRGEPDFDGLVVGLGALGAVTRITMDVELAYEVRQRVFEGLSWEALFEHFDEIMSCGYSVSIFTRWGETIDQVWVKSRVTDEPEQVENDLFGAAAAAVDRHPILGLDASSCTPQLGRASSWADRLPHFRMGFTPSSGEELQSEYLFPRRYAVEAIEAVRSLADEIRPILQVSEIRAVAADRLWMSMNYGQDTVGIHFTWKPERESVEDMLVQLETALVPFEARPHGGKLFNANAEAIAPLYERMSDFIRLVERLDPRGAFRNSWLEAHVLGES
jgi:alditol oxidase